MTDLCLYKGIQWFEKNHPLNGYKQSFICIKNTEAEIKNKVDDISNKILSQFNHDAKTRAGAAFIGYGFATAASIINGRKLTLTHQVLYDDSPIWYTNLSSTLNINLENIYNLIEQTSDKPLTDEQIRNAEIGEFLKWILSPKGNLEISESILKKMCCGIVREISSRMPGRNRKEIKLFFPLISKDIPDPNWKSIFSNLRNENIQLAIVNQAEMFEVKEKERMYIVWQHAWENDFCYIIQAIQLENGKRKTIGAFAFFKDMKFIPLKSIQEAHVLLSDVSEETQSKEQIQRKKALIQLKTINSIPEGFISYLGNHSAGFYQDFYAKHTIENNPTSLEAKKIIDILQGDVAMQMTTIAGKLYTEKYLQNIALSDLVCIGIALENKNLFYPTTVKAIKKHHRLVTKNIFEGEDFDSSTIAGIPSNYGSFRWQLINSPSEDSYMKISESEIRKKGLNWTIEAIIRHFQNPTTDQIADELLYINGEKGDPTALFVAKLFCYISTMNNIINQSRTEEIKEFVVQNPTNITLKKDQTNNVIPKKQSKQSERNPNIRIIKTKQKIISKEPDTSTHVGLAYNSEDFWNYNTLHYLWYKYAKISNNILDIEIETYPDYHFKVYSLPLNNKIKVTPYMGNYKYEDKIITLSSNEKVCRLHRRKANSNSFKEYEKERQNNQNVTYYSLINSNSKKCPKDHTKMKNRLISVKRNDGTKENIMMLVCPTCGRRYLSKAALSQIDINKYNLKRI